MSTQAIGYDDYNKKKITPGFGNYQGTLNGNTVNNFINSVFAPGTVTRATESISPSGTGEAEGARSL